MNALFCCAVRIVVDISRFGKHRNGQLGRGTKRPGTCSACLSSCVDSCVEFRAFAPAAHVLGLRKRPASMFADYAERQNDGTKVKGCRLSRCSTEYGTEHAAHYGESNGIDLYEMAESAETELTTSPRFLPTRFSFPSLRLPARTSSFTYVHNVLQIACWSGRNKHNRHNERHSRDRIDFRRRKNKTRFLHVIR